MAAPTLLSELSTTPTSTNVSTLTVNIPTGAAGDVVEAKVSSTSNADLTTTSTGWRLVRQWKFAAGLSGAVFRKKVGTTGTDALVVSTATAARLGAMAERYPVGTRLYCSPDATATATSTNSNPPLVNHLKSRDVLYEAWRFGIGTPVPSAPPTGYGTTVNNAATSGGPSISVARKTATSSSDDPSTFTVASALWGSITIAHWIDTTGPLLTYWKSLFTSPSQNLRLLCIGTSLEAGRLNAGGGTDTQGSNSFATSRPAVWAAGFTALPGKAFLLGTAGLVTPSNTTMAALDNRFSAGASFVASDSFSFLTIGRAGWGLNTAGEKASFVSPWAFDRVRVILYGDPSLTPYTIDVNGGTPQTITSITTAGYQQQTFNLTGAIGSTLNITAVTGGAAVILGIEVWTNGVYQVSSFNAGWSSGNSNDFVAAPTSTGTVNAILSLAPHLTIMEPNFNDSAASIALETGKESARVLMLAALVSGDAMYTVPPYTTVGSEATEDAYWANYQDVVDEVGGYFYSVHVETGWTSKTASNTAGYTDNLNYHMYAPGYASWGGFERAKIDPGPAGTNYNVSATFSMGAVVLGNQTGQAKDAASLAAGAAVTGVRTGALKVSGSLGAAVILAGAATGVAQTVSNLTAGGALGGNSQGGVAAQSSLSAVLGFADAEQRAAQISGALGSLAGLSGDGAGAGGGTDYPVNLEFGGVAGLAWSAVVARNAQSSLGAAGGLSALAVRAANALGLLGSSAALAAAIKKDASGVQTFGAGAGVAGVRTAAASTSGMISGGAGMDGASGGNLAVTSVLASAAITASGLVAGQIGGALSAIAGMTGAVTAQRSVAVTLAAGAQVGGLMRAARQAAAALAGGAALMGQVALGKIASAVLGVLADLAGVIGAVIPVKPAPACRTVYAQPQIRVVEAQKQNRTVYAQPQDRTVYAKDCDDDCP